MKILLLIIIIAIIILVIPNNNKKRITSERNPDDKFETRKPKNSVLDVIFNNISKKWKGR